MYPFSPLLKKKDLCIPFYLFIIFVAVVFFFVVLSEVKKTWSIAVM